MPCALKKRWQRTNVVGAEDHINVWGLLDDRLAVLLRQAATYGQLKVWVFLLLVEELRQRCVEAIIGILANGAGVENNNVGFSALRVNVTGSFEQASKTFGVVNVHLASEGANLVAALFSGGSH